MKICRVSQTYPTKENEGKGLHTYYTSDLIETPTLVITKYYDEEYLNPKEHVRLKKIKYIQFPFPPSKKFFFKYLLAVITYILGQLQFAIKSAYYVYKFQPDLIHLQSPHAFLIGLFGKILSKKVVVTFHGSDLRRVANNKLFMSFLKLFDGFFYVSSDMESILKKHFPSEKIYFTPSGVNIDFYSDIYNLKHREKIILSVGNIRWQKDYVTLIESFALIYKKFPEYKLVIIGRFTEEREKDRVVAKINELAISDSVELLGYQDKHVIRDYMSKAKLFTLSSVTEGMPKVILESFACGLPVVATNVGECKVLVSDSGIIVPKQSPNEMAQEVMELLQDEKKYESMLKNIKSNVVGFSWKENSDRLLNIFKKIV